MSSLPEEMYLDILLRVPVKSTFVCKCVCKSWFQLISDSDFAKMHLNHTITTKTNNCNVMFRIGSDPENVYSLSYDLLLNEYSDANDFVKLDFPCEYLHRIELLGSCNGVVYFWSREMLLYFLWNPATKECKKLPQSGTNDKYLGRCYPGLGYDSVADDYKLVEIVENEDTSVKIYSLKSDSWKSIESIQYELHPARTTTRVPSGVLFNGALHWFGGRRKVESSIMIISMDINEETFKEMQLPTIISMTLSKKYNYSIDMGVLDGYLCVHAYAYANGKCSIEVWVMLEYGVSESWTKLHTITPDTAFYSDFYVTSFKNGEILFRGVGGQLILCDLKYGGARKTNIYGIHIGSAVSYFESLVSLKSIATMGRGKKREITGNFKKSTN